MVTIKRYQQIFNYEKYIRGSCEFCRSIKQLEFAHIKETAVKGMGRGKKNRAYDIKDNPDCYMLLCKECHTDYDKHKIKKIIDRQVKYLNSLVI